MADDASLYDLLLNGGPLAAFLGPESPGRGPGPALGSSSEATGVRPGTRAALWPAGPEDAALWEVLAQDAPGPSQAAQAAPSAPALEPARLPQPSPLPAAQHFAPARSFAVDQALPPALHQQPQQLQQGRTAQHLALEQTRPQPAAPQQRQVLPPNPGSATDQRIQQAASRMPSTVRVAVWHAPACTDAHRPETPAALRRQGAELAHVQAADPPPVMHGCRRDLRASNSTCAWRTPRLTGAPWWRAGQLAVGAVLGRGGAPHRPSSAVVAHLGEQPAQVRLLKRVLLSPRQLLAICSALTLRLQTQRQDRCACQQLLAGVSCS